MLKILKSSIAGYVKISLSLSDIDERLSKQIAEMAG